MLKHRITCRESVSSPRWKRPKKPRDNIALNMQAWYGGAIIGSMWNMACSILNDNGICMSTAASGEVAPFNTSYIMKLDWKSRSSHILRWCLTPETYVLMVVTTRGISESIDMNSTKSRSLRACKSLLYTTRNLLNSSHALSYTPWVTGQWAKLASSSACWQIMASLSPRASSTPKPHNLLPVA